MEGGFFEKPALFLSPTAAPKNSVTLFPSREGQEPLSRGALMYNE
jgi:hypothetical protein